MASLIYFSIYKFSFEKMPKNNENASGVNNSNTQAREACEKRISKQKNLLKFQTFVAQKEPNPMPDGPKRKEAERKLEELKTAKKYQHVG